MKESRDYGILLRMIEHCKRIEELRERFGDNLESFSSDLAYEEAVNMNIFQLGELSRRIEGCIHQQVRNEHETLVTFDFSASCVAGY